MARWLRDDLRICRVLHEIAIQMVDARAPAARRAKKSRGCNHGEKVLALRGDHDETSGWVGTLNSKIAPRGKIDRPSPKPFGLVV
jgi:hypothetical protein